MSKPAQPPSSSIDLSAQGDVIVGGDVIGRDKIVKNIQNIYRRALSAAEEAEQSRAFEAQRLAQGVIAFVQRLQARANETTDRGGPYKGLLEYRLSDAELFLGRERAIREVLQHLGRGSLTILHSESGAGKTSLLQAGLSPRLIAAGHLPVHIRPYNLNPALALKQVFLSNPGQTPTLAAAPLRDFLRQVSTVLGTGTALDVFVDQFEEFFTLPDEPARAEFVRELAECLGDESLNLRWVLALRTEYFGHLAVFRPRIRNPFENDYRLNRLTRAEAQEVITEPAKRQGLTFELGLLDTLLDDLGGSEIAPPQIQLVCLSLFEELEPGQTTITRALYDREGRAAGILRGHLGRVLSRDLSPQHRTAARHLLEALVSAESQRLARTRGELVAELSAKGIAPETLDEIVSQLVDSRLLRTLEGEAGGGELAYELAHDYLVGEIRLDPDVQARKAAQELLEQEVRAYRRHKTLLAEDRLRVIEPYRRELRLTPEAEQLLAESKAEVERERRAEEARRQAELENERENAARLEANLARAEGLRLAAEANVILQSLAGDAETAALLAIRGLQSTYSSQADAALVKASSRLYTLKQFTGHTDGVSSVTFSPDGKYVLTGSQDNTARLWNAATRQEVRVFTGHANSVSSVAFSPDGEYVLTGSHDNTARLWNAATGQEVRVFTGHANSVSSVAFSPDGKYVLTGGLDDTARLWDAATGRAVRVFTGYAVLMRSVVRSVAFSPDGKYVLTGSDDTARLWDSATGQGVRVFTDYAASMRSVAFSPDGKYALTGSWDATARLWDVQTGKEVRVFTGHTGSVESVAFSPDGKYVLTGSGDATARLWNAATGQAVRVFTGHTDGVSSVAFSPDGKYVLTGSGNPFDGDDNTARLWHVATGPAVSAFTGHTNSVLSVAFSPDGKYALTGSWDATARLWDAATGQEVRTFTSEPSGLSSVAFSPDGKYVLMDGGDTTARLCNAATGQAVRVFTGHTSGVKSVAFSPDGKHVLTGSLDKTARLWDAQTGRAVRVFSGHTNFVHSVAFSPNGKYVLTGSQDNTARLWNAATGQEVRVFTGQVDGVSSVAFSPDGKYVLTGGGDKAVRLWDVATGQAVRVFTGHIGNVTSVAFSPNGKYVLTGGGDKTARLWDMATGQTVRVFTGHTNSVESAAFSPDGKYVLTGSLDDTARLWDTDYHDFIRRVCLRLVRDLTDGERAQYNITDERPTCPGP